MSADLMTVLIEATIMTTIAILVVLALRPVLAGMFGIRAAILIWALVPLALIAGVLPARSIDIGGSTDIQTVISLDGLGAVASTAQQVGQSFPISWRTAAFVVWLAGTAVMLLVLAHRQNRFRRLLGALRPAGRRLLASDRVTAGPALLGVIRPRVIVPRDFDCRFDARQRRLMLAHEYTHLLRGDPVWNLIAAGLRCVFWFNPVVHLAATRFRHDQELACDATVLARRRHARRAYAAALLAQQDNLPVPAIGFGAHPLKERIRMLADDTLHLEHRDDESGWSAEVTIERMPDAKFWVKATIRSNDEVVATPRMIIGPDSPASIETRNPETGEVAYRLVLTPVDPAQINSAGARRSDSAMLFLTINDTDVVARQVEWPRAPGESMSVDMSYSGESEPWNASVELRRHEGDRIELCFDGFQQQDMTRSIMEDGGCLSFDADTSNNKFIRGEFENAGIPWRLDMVPDTIQLIGPQDRLAPANDTGVSFQPTPPER